MCVSYWVPSIRERGGESCRRQLAHGRLCRLLRERERERHTSERESVREIHTHTHDGEAIKTQLTDAHIECQRDTHTHTQTEVVADGAVGGLPHLLELKLCTTTERQDDTHAHRQRDIH